jgi:hypothetical protein
MRRLPDRIFRSLLAFALAIGAAAHGSAQTNTGNPAIVPVNHAAGSPARVHKFKALDADNHVVVLNRPGMVTVVLGTSEDSQDAARAAGKVMYPLQGRPDFQLIVVVDLRGSMATWVPSMVLDRMRSSLDQEAVELKPYFLNNGNKSNPRTTSYVVPDFSGTICPQLGWTEGSDDLRGILFGIDGRELLRWDKIDDMGKLQNDTRAAIQALIDSDKAKAAATAKTQGTKLIQPSSAHPPMLPPVPISAGD